MEWFMTVQANLPASELQRHIRVETLPDWCPQPPAGVGGAAPQPQSDWAYWRVHREVIREGLRFTLPGAIPALQWSLTAGSGTRPGTVMLHLTLAAPDVEPTLVAAMEAFMGNWRQGLEAGVQRLRAQRAEKSAAVCESYASSGFG